MSCCICASAHHGSAPVEQWFNGSFCASLCATLFLLVSGVGEAAALLGMEEIQMLAAFAKQHMKKSHSVRLSDLDPSQWGCIRKNAGASREMQKHFL